RFARLAQLFGGLLLGGGEMRGGLIGRRQTIGDLLRALVQCLHDRRPHELHRDPRENEEHGKLSQQRCVDIHGSTPPETGYGFAITWRGRTDWRTRTSSRYRRRSGTPRR